MSWTIVPQTMMVGRIEAEVLAKPVRMAKNEAGKMDDSGNVPEFIGIPTVVILFFRKDSWPTGFAFKLVHSPRFKSFTLHYPDNNNINPADAKLKSRGLSGPGMLDELIQQNIPSDFANDILAECVIAAIPKNPKKEKADKPKLVAPKVRKLSAEELVAAANEARLLEWKARRAG